MEHTEIEWRPDGELAFSHPLEQKAQAEETRQKVEERVEEMRRLLEAIEEKIRLRDEAGYDFEKDPEGINVVLSRQFIALEQRLEAYSVMSKMWAESVAKLQATHERCLTMLRRFNPDKSLPN